MAIRPKLARYLDALAKVSEGRRDSCDGNKSALERVSVGEDIASFADCAEVLLMSTRESFVLLT